MGRQVKKTPGVHRTPYYVNRPVDNTPTAPPKHWVASPLERGTIGLTTAAELLANFLSGTGAAVDFPAG